MHENMDRISAQNSLSRITQINGEDCVVLSIEVAQMISQLLDNRQVPHQNPQESISKIESIRTLSKEEVQSLRYKVIEMVESKNPLSEIPHYMGKKIHGEAIPFFQTHYSPFISHNQEVIFTPDLKAIDERLLNALRNECRDGIQMPIGNRSDRAKALNGGRFMDYEYSAMRSYIAI